MLEQLHEVIRTAVTPSWVGSIPANFGAAAAGTPKADEWRNIFTIYLPLALIVMTIRRDVPGLMDAVNNTMDLVCALLAGYKQWTSDPLANGYLSSICHYIDGLNRLHPNVQLHSIHHMAFHIYNFLCLFGPVHSWWCFPFERLIGKLQRTTHNHWFGKLEGTIYRAFVDGGNLRQWLLQPSCPDVVCACKTLFDKIYIPKHNDYALERMLVADKDMAPVKLAKVSADLAPLMDGQTEGIFCACIKINRTVYSRQETHNGNSHIMFYCTKDLTGNPVPGSIQEIFCKGSADMFAVRQYRPVDSSTPDPFAKWSWIFRAKLWSSNMESELVEVDPQNVLSHCVKYQLSEDKVIILTLGRVSDLSAGAVCTYSLLTVLIVLTTSHILLFWGVVDLA
jgi:hypothetical protein